MCRHYCTMVRETLYGTFQVVVTGLRYEQRHRQALDTVRHILSTVSLSVCVIHRGRDAHTMSTREAH